MTYFEFQCWRLAERPKDSRAGSRFAAVRFKTIHFYGSSRVGPSTPDLCITVATHASFLYLMRFYLFSDVHVFLLLFYCSSFELIVIFLPMAPTKKTEKKTKSKHMMLHSFLMSSEPRPGPSSTK